MRTDAVSWLFSLALPCHLVGEKHLQCASLRMLVPKSISKQIDEPSKSFQACENPEATFFRPHKVYIFQGLGISSIRAGGQSSVVQSRYAMWFRRVCERTFGDMIQ